MRALSGDERAMLAAMCSPTGGFVWNASDADSSRWESACESLISRGCCTHHVDIDEDGDECDFYTATELGRLALRVSVKP